MDRSSDRTCSPLSSWNTDTNPGLPVAITSMTSPATLRLGSAFIAEPLLGNSAFSVHQEEHLSLTTTFIRLLQGTEQESLTLLYLLTTLAGHFFLRVDSPKKRPRVQEAGAAVMYSSKVFGEKQSLEAELGGKASLPRLHLKKKSLLPSPKAGQCLSWRRRMPVVPMVWWTEKTVRDGCSLGSCQRIGPASNSRTSGCFSC